MNKEEAENLLIEVCDKTKVSPWDVYRDWATISPDELLAFANACEKIGMEKLRPFNWTKEMSDAWHQNIPDVRAAFDALIKKST